MFLKKVKEGYFYMAKHDFETSQEIIVTCVQYNETFIKEIIQNAITFWKKKIFPLLLSRIEK